MTKRRFKGLQGDIVILADACRERRQFKPQLVGIWKTPRIHVYWLAARETKWVPSTPGGPARHGGAGIPEFYVAMTRARDRLYVTGWHATKIIRKAAGTT